MYVQSFFYTKAAQYYGSCVILRKLYVREGGGKREKDVPFGFILLNQIPKEILINPNCASVN